MKVVVVKYNAGNARSVRFALERIGVEALWTDSIEEIESADRVIFPGVGAAGPAMEYLREQKLDQVLKNLSQPVLGICLGMQLMCRFSEEGAVDCLDLFPVTVKRFTDVPKIPHMGWNELYNFQGNLFISAREKAEERQAFCYFVHSYYVPICKATTAFCKYSSPFSAAIQRANYFGVQFHPEKSANFGSEILKNFLELV